MDFNLYRNPDFNAMQRKARRPAKRTFGVFSPPELGV
jgi:hypothetical protein